MLASVRYQPATNSKFQDLKSAYLNNTYFPIESPFFKKITSLKRRSNLIPQSKHLPMEINTFALLFCTQFFKIT